MPIFSRSIRASLFLLAITLAITPGCSCDDAMGDPDAGTDAGSGTDATAPVDAGTDAGTDAGACTPACSGATPVCDPASGTCVECLAATDCDDADPCTADACDAATSTCSVSYADGPGCDPTWSMRTPDTSPPALIWPAMVYDEANDRTILFGGMRGDMSQSDETWAWDGSDWMQLTPAASPSARFVHGMVYDSGRGRAVLFGGLPDAFSTAGLADTWEWDGTNWMDAMPDASPPGRGVHANLAYDRVRDVTVLVAGGSQPGAMIHGDVWEYDGSTWMMMPLGAEAPEARVAACLVFDETAGTTMLFGGGTWGSFFDDTWTWNGASFAEQMPATSPPPRQSLGCAWDAWRGRASIFGGAPDNAGTLIADSWDWNGTTWTDTTAAGPPNSCCHGMAFDRARREMVVFTQGQTWILAVP